MSEQGPINRPEGGEQVVKLQVEPGHTPEKQRFQRTKSLLAKTAIGGAIAVGIIGPVYLAASWVYDNVSGFPGDVAGAVKGVVEDGFGVLEDGVGSVAGIVGDGAKALASIDSGGTTASLSAGVGAAEFPNEAPLFNSNVKGESSFTASAVFGFKKDVAGAGRFGKLKIYAKGTGDDPVFTAKTMEPKNEKPYLLATFGADSFHATVSDPDYQKDKDGEDRVWGDNGILNKVWDAAPGTKSKIGGNAGKMTKVADQNMRTQCARKQRVLIPQFSEQYVSTFFRQNSEANKAIGNKDVAKSQAKIAKMDIKVRFVDSKGKSVPLNTLNLHTPPEWTKERVADLLGKDEVKLKKPLQKCEPNPLASKQLQESHARTFSTKSLIYK